MNVNEASIPSRFAEDLKTVDKALLALQRAAIEEHKASRPRVLMPVDDPREEPCVHPSPVMREKKVGCVVMAGGQATRLGNALPKGIIPFSCVAKKPLLQILAEKVAAYSHCYGVNARLAIMTSEGTDAATREFFERHHFFGLPHVDFFVQGSLPLLDMEGKIIMESDGRLLKGPDGNGGVFAELVRSGIAGRWEDDGVEAVSIIMVDNPLIDPFCPSLFDPIFQGCDLTAAAIERVREEEKVGLFALENGRIEVVEYSEIDPKVASRRDEDGRLIFRWANISAFACSLPYIKSAASTRLPLHVAQKTVQGREVWKAEYFVFDAMAAAKTIRLVPLVRKDFFSPVKDKASFDTACLDMMARDQRRFFELTGVRSEEETSFELSASAYYPTAGFLEWLRGCGLRRGFVARPSEGSS